MPSPKPVLDLPSVIKLISPSVVALGHRIEISANPEPPSFPQVIGSGFVVDTRGLIATNQHVVKALKAMPNAARFAALFTSAVAPSGDILIGVLFRKIKLFYQLESFEFTGQYFGDATPDLAFAVIDMQGLPALHVSAEENSLIMGNEVVTVGFPMGRVPLSPHSPDALAQIHPFARRGIISSVTPCPCPNPHGFTIDVLSEGGASGSPICSAADGSVIGVLYASFDGAPITYGVPGHVLMTSLNSVLEQWKPDASAPHFARVVAEEITGGPQPMTWNRVSLSSSSS